jgi:hypothetical protein
MIEPTGSLARDIGGTVGLFRAEYLEDKIFAVMERPLYWDQLTDARPCFIVGGRGTGKTTALRALSYDGQSSVLGVDVATWSTIGFYWRIETSVVTVFRGERLIQSDWTRLFSHYANLQMCRSIAGFLTWWTANHTRPLRIDVAELRNTAVSLGINENLTIDSLSVELESALTRFEVAVNSMGREVPDLPLSVLGRPIRHLLAALKADSAIAPHYFTFAIDEYENLESYQQRALNTLVKHVGDASYTFKIGTKETGLRERATLNSNEFLSEPADYTTVDVEDSIKRQGFPEFAARVCNDRLAMLSMENRPIDVRALFPDLPEEKEALLLGAELRIAEIRSELRADGAAPIDFEYFDALGVMGACMVGYWAQSRGRSPLDVLREASMDETKWRNRVNNYGYSMLFTIRAKVSGHRKLYAGWSTLSQLADGNIRYLLQLVTEALTMHAESGASLRSPVSPTTQTKAAEQVGERAVFELTGLHARGTQLTRLVLALGRVFGVMASDPFGHAPEVTQFHVDRVGQHLDEQVNELLLAGVMHDAFVRFAGDKAAARSGKTKEHDFQLHPIFAPFFCFSHRRKRRLVISDGELLALSNVSSQGTIAKILRRNARNPNAHLPEQLALFQDFYNDAE